jgi:hypothetical protein
MRVPAPCGEWVVSGFRWPQPSLAKSTAKLAITLAPLLECRINEP